MDPHFNQRTYTSKSGERTVMNLMPPGDITGEYYILVSNLPFRIRWQNLKDWARDHCPGIDMVVQVYRSSSCGWIKVYGRQNFETVFNLVDGGHFHGRALFASGRNATEYVPIKELVRSARKTNPIRSSPEYSSHDQEHHQNLQSSTYEEEPVPAIRVHPAEAVVTFSSESVSSVMSSPPYDHARLMPVSPEPAFELPNCYHSGQHINFGHQTTTTYHSTGPHRIASDCIKPSSNPSIPVLRLIEVYHLPTSVSISEVDAWIKSTTGPRSVQIELISVRDEQMMPGDGAFHRTASVICKDAKISKVILSILNGAQFHATTGELRTVMAKLPAKGVTVWEVKDLVHDLSTTSLGRSLQVNQL